MATDPMNYEKMMERALRGVVREALDEAAKHGLPGEHHFYITFRTRDPGVQIPPSLLDRYPSEMTIVLQHQFWGLEVDEGGFKVTLSFDRKHERLVVPYAALSGFFDPSVQFGLQFQSPAANAAAEPAKPVAAPPPADAAKPAAESGPRVVALDSFRKK